MKRKAILTLAILGSMALAWSGRAERNEAQPSDSVNLINVDFPGGSAADYVSAVRKAAGNANIAVMADISSIKVPAVNLKSVDIGSALEVLESIPHEQTGQNSEIQVNRGAVSSPGQMQVFTVKAKIVSIDRTRRQDSLVVSVSDLLNNNIKADDLLTAIQTALEMLKGDLPPAQIRFHESTGLLIARGHPEQMASITEIVQQLRERRERSLQQNRESIERNLSDCEERAKTASGKLADVSRQVTEWQTRNEIVTKELEHLRDLVQSLEQQNRTLRSEVETMAQRLSESAKKPQ